MKATVSGAVPWFTGLSFRVGLYVASASRSAYVAGPYGTWDSVNGQLPQAALAPVNRFTVLGGLQYAF